MDPAANLQRQRELAESIVALNGAIEVRETGQPTRALWDFAPELAELVLALAHEREWSPIFSPWRHGGWYVDNVRYPSGAVGCVSRNYEDRKWRIVCDPREGSYPGGPNDHTYPSREAAARAERDLIQTAAACATD